MDKPAKPSKSGFLLLLALSLVAGAAALGWHGGIAGAGIGEPVEGIGNRGSARPLVRDAGAGSLPPPSKSDGAQVVRELSAVRVALREQEDLVEEKRKVLDAIVRAIGIPYATGAGGGVFRSAKNVRQAAKGQYYALDYEKRHLDLAIKKLLKLSGEALLKYAASLDLPNNGVTARYEKYQMAVRELDALRASGQGARHPEVIKRAQEVDGLNRDLELAVISLRQILMTQLELVESRLVMMEAALNERHQLTLDASPADYLEAKREYEEAQQEMQQMMLHYSAAQISRLRAPVGR